MYRRPPPKGKITHTTAIPSSLEFYFGAKKSCIEMLGLTSFVLPLSTLNPLSVSCPHYFPIPTLLSLLHKVDPRVLSSSLFLVRFLSTFFVDVSIRLRWLAPRVLKKEASLDSFRCRSRKKFPPPFFHFPLFDSAAVGHSLDRQTDRQTLGKSLLNSSSYD